MMAVPVGLRAGSMPEAITLARQVAAARNENRYSGFALYRYDSVYNPASGVKAAVRAERENLLEIM